MAALRTALVKRRHAYTSTDIPWSMDVGAEGESSDLAKGNWRLFRYLSGGGMRAFGRSSCSRGLSLISCFFLCR